ncbi:uncharacterized protein LOC101848558 [Aplysia californica]|uniref:Uncharacterized protein LOC101848558 n=1 Tax=Aplysia californica TaxID=6500 RepID=A0ABM0K805_APLCA|nr:uncharacterized protein LOC101848558 [Aplysia californica]
MLSTQNSTFTSFNTEPGGGYLVHFTDKSFHSGERFKLYSGIFLGRGAQCPGRCVVKISKGADLASKADCLIEDKKSKQARAFSLAFRELSGRTEIKFVQLYAAEIDEISLQKRLFWSGKHKITRQNYVLFEEDLRENFDNLHFSGREKLSKYLDSKGREKLVAAKDLQAFTHFSYHVSHGKLVICDVEGVETKDGFRLKTPTIHSTAKKFGISDKGEKGIEEVFRHHTCNDICQGMIKPQNQGGDRPRELTSYSEAQNYRRENGQTTQQRDSFVRATAPDLEDISETRRNEEQSPEEMSASRYDFQLQQRGSRSLWQNPPSYDEIVALTRNSRLAQHRGNMAQEPLTPPPVYTPPSYHVSVVQPPSYYSYCGHDTEEPPPSYRSVEDSTQGHSVV